MASSDNIRVPLRTKKESATSFVFSDDEDKSNALNKAKTNIGTKQRREEA